MSYKFLSFRREDVQTIAQWDSRTLAGELESFPSRTLAGVLKKFLPGKKLRVLEGGCGFGAWCVWLEQLGHDVIGLENNEKVVAAALRNKPDVAVRQGDILHIPYPDGHFDAYLSLGVIEHFEEGPGKALAEARRVLKQGGLVFITTPYLNNMRRFISHPV